MKSFSSIFPASRACRPNVAVRGDARSIGSGLQNRNGRCSAHGGGSCLANRGRIAESSGRLQKSVTADDPAQGSSHPDRRLESGVVLATPDRSCLVAGDASETHTLSPGAIVKQDFEEKGGPGQKDPEQHGRNGWIQDGGIFPVLVFRFARNRCGSENQLARGTATHGANVGVPEVEFTDRGARLRSCKGNATTDSDIGQQVLQTLLAELGSRCVRAVTLRGRP
jgi:hypothetical protein